MPGGGGDTLVPPVALIVDLVAAAVDAGVAAQTACRAVARALRDTAPGQPQRAAPAQAQAQSELADDLERIAAGLLPFSPALTDLHDVLARAAKTGVAAAALLRRLAEEERREAQAVTDEATSRLPVLLVLPAGLCLLPAALLLGVVPVVLDLLHSVLQ